MDSKRRFLIVDYEILKNKKLSSCDKLLLAYISSYCKYNKDECFNKSTAFIADELGISSRQVIRSLNHLIEFHLIKVVISDSRGVHSNRFIAICNNDQEDVNVVDLFNYVYSKYIKR